MQEIFIHEDLAQLDGPKMELLADRLLQVDLATKYYKSFEKIKNLKQQVIIYPNGATISPELRSHNTLIQMNDFPQSYNLFGEEEIQNDDIIFDKGVEIEDLVQLIKLKKQFYTGQLELEAIQVAEGNLSKLLSIKQKNKRPPREFLVDYRDYRKELKSIQEDIYKIYNIESLNELLSEFVKSSSFIAKINLAKTGFNLANCYPIKVGKEGVQLVEVQTSSSLQVELRPHVICEVLFLIEEYFRRIYSFDEISEQVKVLEDAFEKIHHPVVLYSKNDYGIVLYNEAFLNLSLTPKYCDELKENSEILINEVSFKVQKKEVSIDNRKHIFLTLIKGLSKDDISDFQQLGIITSSMAHELNNPLAGILATLELLHLDDDWTDEDLETLDEMKKASLRCKQLVEVFLGFSRPELNKCSCQIEHVASQALNIIRFRVVESNVKIAINKCTQAKEAYPVNESVMAIIFYLLMSELMTAYSHHMLLTFNINRIDSLITLEINSTADKVSIIVTPDFCFEDQIKKSKLIGHLSKIQGINLKLSKGQIDLEL